MIVMMECPQEQHALPYRLQMDFSRVKGQTKFRTQKSAHARNQLHQRVL